MGRELHDGVGWLKGLAAVAAVAAVALTGTAFSGMFTSSSSPSSSNAASNDEGGGWERGVTDPCPGATHYSPSALARFSKAAVFLPEQGPDAARDSWICHGDLSATVFMLGNSQITFARLDAPLDSDAYFKALAAQWGGEVSMVQGQPAYFDPSSEPGVFNEILILHGSDSIKLLSPPSESFDSLVGLTKTLNFNRTLGRTSGVHR